MKKKSKKKMYYKVLDKNGHALVAILNLRWSLPYKHRPGMWHTVMGRLVACENGLHLVRTPIQIANWIGYYDAGHRLFTCEAHGTVIVHGKGCNQKYVTRTARLLKEVVRGTPEWRKALKGTRAVTWQPLP